MKTNPQMDVGTQARTVRLYKSNGVSKAMEASTATKKKAALGWRLLKRFQPA